MRLVTFRCRFPALPAMAVAILGLGGAATLPVQSEAAVANLVSSAGGPVSGLSLAQCYSRAKAALQKEGYVLTDDFSGKITKLVQGTKGANVYETSVFCAKSGVNAYIDVSTAGANQNNALAENGKVLNDILPAATARMSMQQIARTR